MIAPLRFSIFSLLLLLPCFLLAQEEEVFQIVEEMPRFSGCEELEDSKEEKQSCAEKKMLEFIYGNIRYPNLAQENAIEGMVVISFVVNEEGKIDSPKILRDIGGGCGEESLRVVNMMPNWIPGKQKGKPVKVQFNLPVRFKLQAPPPAEEIVIDSIPVHEKITPEIMQKLRPTYNGLQYLFCGNFSGEFIDAEGLKGIADDPIDTNNLCGFFFKMSNLAISYEIDNQTTELKSESGEVTQAMRELFKNAKSGGAFNVNYSVERDDIKKDVSKILIIN